jgi:hypothetical protein
MSIEATQRDATNNQSTVDFLSSNIFLFDNRFQGGVFKNTTGAEGTFKNGSLVLRDTTTANQIKPAVAGATLVDVIGILKLESDTTLAIAATKNVNYSISGDIDSGLLDLPAGVTLDTVPTGATKNLRDILTDLGFVLHNVTEQTKFGN